MQLCSLVFLRRGTRVILAKKKRRRKKKGGGKGTESLQKRFVKKVGVNRWNGYGGESLPFDMTPEQGAIREVEEESTVKISMANLGSPSQIDFFEGGKLLYCCLIYVCDKWDGNPSETDEMSPPKEFEIDGLPLDEMMPGDRLWIHRILRGERFVGRLDYDRGKRNPKFAVLRLLP